MPLPGSLLVAKGVVSVILLRPGLVTGVVLVGLSLPGVVGDTKPRTVLETRAETVTRLRSGEAEAEVVELPEETLELVAVRSGFAPFGDFMEPVGVSTPFTGTPGDAATEGEGEEGTGVSDADDLEAPGWTGGRGARYLTLAGSD